MSAISDIDENTVGLLIRYRIIHENWHISLFWYRQTKYRSNPKHIHTYFVLSYISMSIQHGHGHVYGNLKIHISDIGKKVITILYCGSPLSPIHQRFQQAQSEIVRHGYRIERLPMPVAHGRYCTRFYPLCLRGQHLCRSFKNEISCLK